MSEVRLHRLYSHYSELPLSMRILYTGALCIMGMGYLFALIYLFHTYAGRDGNPLDLTYNDLVIAYTGSGKDSKLEAALRGPMAAMLPPAEAAVVTEWVKKGADNAAFDKTIKPIMEQRCVSCHNGSNTALSNLAGLDNVKKLTEKDTGTNVYTLVRVSHIHLFGITFMFFIVGLIFSHAFVRPVWFKCLIIGAPFVCVAIDVSSWYMVKLYHPFAWVTMAAGGMLGVCFAVMWTVSMYQMWIARTPVAVTQRTASDVHVIG